MLFEIHPLTVGQMRSNCYLVKDKKSLETLIIDPGDDGEYIVEQLTRLVCVPKLIIATHGHFDHIMAALTISLTFQIPFRLNCKDQFLVDKMRENARHFLGIDSGPPPLICQDLSDQDQLQLGDINFTVIETPGHTPGSVCLYDKRCNILLCGDLMFAQGGVGRTDFSYSDKNDFNRSLLKILKLDDKTEIYPGHGSTFKLGRERKLILQTLKQVSKKFSL